MKTFQGSLRETDIRPNELKDGMKEASRQDLGWLLYRGAADFVEVSCPACGGNGTTGKEIIKDKLVYVECALCSTVYMNPRPTLELLQRYYMQSRTYRYWNEYVFPASEEIRREQIFLPRAQYVDKMVEPYFDLTTLMDIGAGFGTFCEEVERACIFQRIIALEPTPTLAAVCRERGLDVIESSFEQLEMKPGTIGVVTSFEVLEHIFDPSQFIRHCYQLLCDGGLLMLTCPNIKGFETSLLGASSSTISYEHLNYFHPESLQLLLLRSGFEIIEVMTPGKLDVDLVRKNIDDADICPFLRHLVTDEQLGDKFQEFLAANMLSSHMLVVARK